MNISQRQINEYVKNTVKANKWYAEYWRLVEKYGASETSKGQKRAKDLAQKYDGIAIAAVLSLNPEDTIKAVREYERVRKAF